MTVRDSAAPRRPANALARETSPYLLQHAHNPVDWHPWGPEALALARDQAKPIHLSIGYAACHWCHVLAHESFEDEATAQLLNEHFVNIKVDREERPDLDRIYQIAQQLLTQRGGGWPLTMFLMPDDQRPFFGGTYFPPEPRHGLPAFREVIVRVAEYYREHTAELRAQNEALVEAFATLEPSVAAAAERLDDAPLRACRRDLERTFDRASGGFGGAPKFPHPGALERLLRDWHATAHTPEPDLHALFMATLTLTRMGEGGLFDHLAGGFSRYSVDARWMIPHFEKMLYDNGALLAVYADAYLATGEPLFARIAARTADYLIADLQAPQGGFVSSRDADSEGHEGKFYVWDRDEVRAALTPAEYAAFALRFGLDRTPNFEGHWHLHAFEPLGAVAAALGMPPSEVQAAIDAASAKLLAIRAHRVPPARDDKVLTSWNALAIRGLARAARALDRPDYAVAASRALDYLRASHCDGQRLLATSRDGQAHLAAYLDDYVYLADAILELAQIRWRSDEARFAATLLDTVLTHFEDRERGGFYFTADDHEVLFHRSRSFGDDAIPSGNGVAASALLRWGYVLGEPRYLAAAERTLRAAWPALTRAPQAHVALLLALEDFLEPPQVLVLRGVPATLVEWQREVGRTYAPRRITLAIPADAPDLPPALADKTPRGDAVAYLCRGTVCSAPIESLPTLARDLRLALAFSPPVG